jgi:large subunit ribosomal protein L24
MKSLKSRKQRKEYFNAPLHKKRKWISSHLEENLLLKYDKRRVTLVEGDNVKIMRGSFKGHEGKITNVNQRRRFVEVEGLVMTKADGKKIPKPIHASNLLITKLNLTDKWRRDKLERTLSDDVKKEIEKEAEKQIIETEQEKRNQEEKEKEEKKISEKEDDEKLTKKPIKNDKEMKNSIGDNKKAEKTTVDKDEKIIENKPKEKEIKKSDNKLKNKKDENVPSKSTKR